MGVLRFDFEAGAERAYSDPVAVHCARTLEDVPGVIADVESALTAGFHAAGFLAYEAAGAFDTALLTRKPTTMPIAWFGIYPEKAKPAPTRPAAFRVSDWQPDTGQSRHAAAVSTIREYIAAGDTYQVNHTFRLHSRLTGSEAGFYHALLSRQPAAYAAWLQTEDWGILSASPELFFRREGSLVTTRPMKGTSRRSADPVEDAQLAARLQESAKNRAENIMITDLLRNDLGRIADPGTVRVPTLLAVESQPTFHALTSTVTAHSDAGLSGLLTALFPCGSITGAPKARTMELIRELEDSPRGAYCGAIGWIEPGGDCAFSVAIRTVTLERDGGRLTYGTGGGITWDSEAADEYAEALLKARFLPGSVPAT